MLPLFSPSGYLCNSVFRPGRRMDTLQYSIDTRGNLLYAGSDLSRIYMKKAVYAIDSFFSYNILVYALLSGHSFTCSASFILMTLADIVIEITIESELWAAADS